MFETPLIERFSRVHPAAPFVFWIPVLTYFAYGAYQSATPLLAVIGLVVLGALTWSLTEYLLHRFVFHRLGPKLVDRRLFFIFHGVHHDFPQDATRLVMPLGVSIPIGAIFYLIFRLAVGPVLAAPVFVGFGIGYLSYDGIHYAVHHFRLTSPIGRYLKRYHMVHHHTGESARWGVSSPLWDWVFGTMASGARTSAPAAPGSQVSDAT
jgi:sterol desaturase/sphingolipid hydroxylase (fatty acid hydroxylase superfamily)